MYSPRAGKNVRAVVLQSILVHSILEQGRQAQTAPVPLAITAQIPLSNPDEPILATRNRDRTQPDPESEVFQTKQCLAALKTLQASQRDRAYSA
jgi:hypothetical protein